MFATPIAIPGVELRLVEDRHVQAVHDTVRRNLEHLRPWMPWAVADYSLEGCRSWQRQALEQFARNDGFNAGIFHGDTFTGVIGLHSIDWASRSTTIGYWIAVEYQGRGIVTAACRTLVAHLFDVLKLNRVVIRCAPMNVRSRRIPERLGFCEEGVAREAERAIDGRYVDLVVYSMLAAEWQQKQVGI